MDAIKHAGQYLNAKAQGGAATMSKESNKSVAKDSHVSMGTRLHAAKNAASDKIDESKHNRNADIHKHAAKHNY